jgi:quercetin dioxygenase-like cupin family protein
MFVLAGRGETTVGTETREWGPGQVFLLEDTAPPGHGTRILEDTLIAVVRC